MNQPKKVVRFLAIGGFVAAQSPRQPVAPVRRKDRGRVLPWHLERRCSLEGVLMKLLKSVLKVLLAGLLPAVAAADIHWHWQFEPASIPMQPESTIYAEIFNDDEVLDLLPGHIEITSLPNDGMFGVPELGKRLAFTVLPPRAHSGVELVLHPGESRLVPVLTFVLYDGPVTPTIPVYEFAPYLWVRWGQGCTSSSLVVCPDFAQLRPTSPLRLVVSEVPEPANLALLLCGLAVLLAAGARRW